MRWHKDVQVVEEGLTYCRAYTFNSHCVPGKAQTQRHSFMVILRDRPSVVQRALNVHSKDNSLGSKPSLRKRVISTALQNCQLVVSSLTIQNC